jgi:hypothetical protein
LRNTRRDWRASSGIETRYPAGLPTPGEAYTEGRDVNRAESKAAAKDQPLAYFGAGLAASLPVAALTTPIIAGAGAGLGVRVGTGVVNGALQGTLAGVGNSEADTAGGVLKDARNGLGAGAALGGALGLAGGAVGAVNRFAGGKVQAGLDRATQMAEERQTELERSARGALGAESQKGSRIIENLLRQESTGSLTPEHAALLQNLRDSGQWQRLVQGVTEGNLADLPGQLDAITQRRDALGQLVQNRAANVSQEADRIVSPAEAGKQVMARVARYGPVLAGGLLGKAVGAVPEPGTGLLAGAGIRPALNAVKRMMGHPSVQVPTYKLVQGLTKLNPQALEEAVGPGAAGVLTRALGEGDDAYAAAHFVLNQVDPKFSAGLAKIDEEKDK